MKNGLYRVDHDVFVNMAMTGEAHEVVTLEELHRKIGHIAPEAAKRMVSSGAVDRTELDLTSTIQACNSCQYAKATRKPISKVWVAPRAKNFSDEIHSDVWGPSPVKKTILCEFYG